MTIITKLIFILIGFLAYQAGITRQLFEAAKAVEAKLKKEPAKNKKISNKKAPKPKKVSKK